MRLPAQVYLSIGALIVSGLVGGQADESEHNAPEVEITAPLPSAREKTTHDVQPTSLAAPPPLPTPIVDVAAASTTVPVVMRPPAHSYRPGIVASGIVNANAQMSALAMDPMTMADAPMMPPHFKPETKDELFARIDTNRDGSIKFDDYLKRDRFYLEAIRNEFNQIDTNHDSKVSKQEFDDYIERLEDQRKLSFLRTSNFTLQRHDLTGDGALNEQELSAYINGSLQRDTAQLHDVFRQFDIDENGKLNLPEFNELDFHFPWERFPLKESAFMQAQIDAVSDSTFYSPQPTAIGETSASLK